MNSLIFKISAFSLFFGFFASLTQAANPASVVINEIAWMGTAVSYNDEWIELYNNADSPISLDGWELKTADGSPEIKLTGSIPASGFYLLERTDDNTVPGVKADQIYSGSLGNNGETVGIYDGAGNLIDEVSASLSWPAGDNVTKQTMEKNSSGWQTSQNYGGTPKTENSKAAENGPPQTSAEDGPTRSPENGPPITTEFAEDGSPQIETAAAKESIRLKKNSEAPAAIMIAAVLAVFSGATVIFLKRKLNA